jgi:hypothetical protein
MFVNFRQIKPFMEQFRLFWRKNEVHHEQLKDALEELSSLSIYSGHVRQGRKCRTKLCLENARNVEDQAVTQIHWLTKIGAVSRRRPKFIGKLCRT